MSKHTPGPWRIGQTFSDDEGYPEIAVMATVRGHEVCPATVVLGFPNMPGMQEANAHLIAAAPELLDALRAAHSDIQRLAGHTIDMLGRVEAAIAKAKGEA